ncbi:MAG TPA: PAS domain S-box protein [Bryobacteraceae bacterium]|nr:PAS domain S-box protein [Bryobacteraceae bacterium]
MREESPHSVLEGLDLPQAEKALLDLAEVFLNTSGEVNENASDGDDSPNIETQYRTLVEQIPAVVFMVYLDRGAGEAYISPHIESTLGFSREEWLEDPVRWYERIHPDDKSRWSSEAAEMFLSGGALHSVYRVLARDGHVVSFHCDARMVRRKDGRPWFIHGVAFDITDLKRAEAALQEERNFASAVLDTVGALVLVVNPRGKIVRFNHACERSTGYASSEAIGKQLWDLLVVPEEISRIRETFEQLRSGLASGTFESTWTARNGTTREISWSSTTLTGERGALEYLILTGIDVTETNRMERRVLEISGREQKRIGRDLHDGLGQHLTGVAFMSKVLQQKLLEKDLPEAQDAAKILLLVNEAINKTRELSRGLLPVLSDARGLMSALGRMAMEVEDVFQVSCAVEYDAPVLARDVEFATHLYHIAQEAVNNALRHGRPRHIAIRLGGGERSYLCVEDDGVGFRESWPPAPRAQGMGLLIMGYRAKMIGAALEVRPKLSGGTSVCCTFPSGNLELEEGL